MKNNLKLRNDLWGVAVGGVGMIFFYNRWVG